MLINANRWRDAIACSEINCVNCCALQLLKLRMRWLAKLHETTKFFGFIYNFNDEALESMKNYP